MTREEEINKEVARYLFEDFKPTGVITEERFAIGVHMARFADENPKNTWISVEERLPEKTKGVFSCQVRELEEDKIVYYKDTRGYIHTGYLNARNHWRDLDRDNVAIYPVTHWMPITELKKGGEL